MRIFSQNIVASIHTYTINCGEYVSDGYNWSNDQSCDQQMIDGLSRVLGLGPVAVAGAFAKYLREKMLPSGFSPSDERALIEVFDFFLWVRESIARSGRGDSARCVVVNNFNDSRTFVWIHSVD